MAQRAPFTIFRLQGKVHVTQLEILEHDSNFMVRGCSSPDVGDGTPRFERPAGIKRNSQLDPGMPVIPCPALIVRPGHPNLACTLSCAATLYI